MKPKSYQSLQSRDATNKYSDERPFHGNPDRQHGFTSAELLVVIAIISILVGLLVPAVQAVREAANRIAVSNDLPDICCAARDFHEHNGRFPASFPELIRFCEDQLPNLRTECCLNVLRLARLGLPLVSGYVFTITEATDSTWKMQVVPASPGKTGSVGFLTDQDCNRSSFPVPGSDEARQQMFDNIKRRAAQTMANLMAQSPSETGRVIESLQSRDIVPRTFAQLDGNDNGVVDVNEILEYHGTGASLLAPLLSDIKGELQLGLAGEDLNAIPGVSLDDLFKPSPTHDAVLFNARITDGISVTLADAGINLAGFCDGSIRPSGEARILQDRNLVFKEANLFARLEPVASPAPLAFSGDFQITDADQNSIAGILVGLFPSSVSRQQGRVLVIATRGSGLFAGATGSGQATLIFDRSNFGLLRGELKLKPFVTSR